MACESMCIHHIARQIYSDQSDMSGDFPQYRNMRDATKLVKELMLRYGDKSYRSSVPMFATEAGPIYDDARVRAMLDGTSVSYADEPKACAPELTLAEPEKKKSRIVFSKIR